MKPRNRNRRQHKPEKGSALLVSLMVMVALSLLGLGFVAVSETESAISVNQRNYTQTQAVAETGARMVVEWFQNAEWANKRGLLPPNDPALKTQRSVTINPGGSSYLYTGYYKDATNSILCDLPFKPDPDNRFYADENTADILIRDSDGGVATAFLDRFNSIVFAGNDAGGRITEVRVYAPPIVGGTLVERPPSSGKKYWEGGTRYGVSTIRVTATKTVNGQFVAERSVKIVIGDFPFPGPEGPLQSNTGISTNGAFRVHWGKVTSEVDLALKRPNTSVPWRTAWQYTHFEQGFQPSAACDATYLCEHPTDPASANIDLKYNWFYELVGKDFDDPWFQGRARGDITSDSGSTANQPYPYGNITDDVTNAGVAGYSNQFQNQDTNDESINKKEVLFPKIDYVFWKQIAQSGMAAGTSGIYYFTWAGSGEDFNLRAATNTFFNWTNSLTSVGKSGLLFFDTNGGVNPQNADGTVNTAVLTDGFDENGGPNWHMRGFIYLNAKEFGTKGIKGRDEEYAAPSEPIRDVGYREVALANTAAVAGVSPAVNKKDFVLLCGDAPVCNPANYVTKMVGQVNGVWDYEDLPWSNGVSPEKLNNKFDVFVKQYTVTRDSDGTNITVYLPAPYTQGCDPGNNADCPTCTCSEPHEPYLNIIYPSPSACANASCDPATMQVTWQDPAAMTRRPKTFTDLARTTPVTCINSSPDEDCTSNAYDTTGALMDLGMDGPILDGVFYNEGDYNSTGNGIYYGSVLIKGTVSKAGNVDVFYDESLSRGDWQKRFPELPRVLITAIETDR